ncbi:amidase domain-containing protein [Metabacillus fastidiosus]|uniref:amidase domain-containing protein n=1 Tax=Metabacillus fastidiosus TaxID=1458 RepID=UPI000826E7EC|nr:amidase domain-containing protein [Metabacillus fastidiosus]
MKRIVLKSALVSAVVALGLSIGTNYEQVKAESIESVKEVEKAKKEEKREKIKSPENVEKVEKVKKLKTVSNKGKNEDKQDGEKKYKKAMKIAEKYFKEKGIILSNNFDDRNYQQAIISLGAAIESFKGKDQEEILEFVGFMDLYENYADNERIAVLKESFDSGVIEEDELEELLSFTPADDIFTSESPELYNTDGMASVMAAAKNGYDNIKARDYARKWTSNTEILRNNKAYPYYSSVNKNCHSCWNDCTNFVSQAIYAGGMKFRGTTNWLSNSNWWYNNAKPSNTWGGAHNFYNHWKDRAAVVSSVSSLQVGDVVNADFKGDGHIDHTAIITKDDGKLSSNKHLTQHTDDYKEKTTLKNWYDKGYKVYGYEMDKASN